MLCITKPLLTSSADKTTLHIQSILIANTYFIFLINKYVRAMKKCIDQTMSGGPIVHGSSMPQLLNSIFKYVQDI